MNSKRLPKVAKASWQSRHANVLTCDSFTKWKYKLIIVNEVAITQCADEDSQTFSIRF